MKELLKEEEVFELAKKNLKEELEKRYENLVGLINSKEIERDEYYIKFRIGEITQEDYQKADNKLLEEINNSKIGVKNIRIKINKMDEVIR
jgi:hypothetical protein